MAKVRNLLFEIGTEELPPKALLTLAEALATEISTGLQRLNLTFAKIELFATPRRLGVRILDLAETQPAQERIRRGPALAAAFDATGKPSKALLGFAVSCGATVEQLEQDQTNKGTWLVFRQQIAGQAAASLIPDLLNNALAALPIPKRMRWGANAAEFVRPVHWIVLLFGTEVLKTEILGITSGRTTKGHRFHHPEAIEISHPEVYEKLLRTIGMVEPVFAVRRDKIRTLVEATATNAGVHASIDTALLDEVTALCEWPIPVLGAFDRDFLRVPQEALIETMQGHQKYFPVFDQSGNLAPQFITISNIISQDPKQVQAGNERVIRPRFKDAAFFWDQDRKLPLEQRLHGLKSLVFHNKLGSIWDKTQRLAVVSSWIAVQIELDPTLAHRSALLCKCDLLTQMVGEFGSLQGTMGRYLANIDQENPCVAAAIEEHYLPRQAGGSLPQSLCGKALALADRFDNLIGIFAVGLRPTGIKDPYALRRAALGVLRILIETPLALDLRALAIQTAAAFTDKQDTTSAIDEVVNYLLERLPNYYADQAIRSDIVEAVLATGITIPADIDKRIKAIVTFRQLSEAESLAAAYKRIRNILRQVTAIPTQIQPLWLEVTAEQALYQHMEQLRPQVELMFQQGNYSTALSLLAGLRDEIDLFFSTVMVMAEDPNVRDNRLALLASIATLFGQIADFSLLQ